MEAVIENGKVTNIIIGHLDNSLPLEDIKPTVSKYQKIDGFTYDIQANKVVKNYTVVDISLSNSKTQKLQELKSKFIEKSKRPRVSLTLQDGTQIEIDGGRADKDNFKEEYKRLQRKSLTSTIIKDADNNFHNATDIDVQNGYYAIVDNFANLMAWKWAKEQEINACTTVADLDAVVI